MYIYLLRHAEAESDMHNPDKNRKLSKAGIEDANLLNKFILDKGLRFDLVLSSSSTRTRETSEIILNDVVCDKDPEYLDELYQIYDDSNNIHTHNWEAGDLVVWNNMTVSHKRDHTPSHIRRRLVRYAFHQ